MNMEYLSFKRKRVYTTGWQRKTDNNSEYFEEISTAVEIERNPIIIAQIACHDLDGKFLWGYHPGSLYPKGVNAVVKVGTALTLTEAREHIQNFMFSDPYIHYVEMSRHRSGIIPKQK